MVCLLLDVYEKNLHQNIAEKFGYSKKLSSRIQVIHELSFLCGYFLSGK
jgi:hypothetical protein